MVKAIAFDLDLTLVDFVYMKEQTALAAAKAMVREGLKTKVSKLYKQIFSIYGKDNWEYQKTFRDVLLKFYPGLSPNEFEHYQQAAILAYLEEKPRSLRVYSDVIPTLKKLKKTIQDWEVIWLLGGLLGQFSWEVRRPQEHKILGA